MFSLNTIGNLEPCSIYVARPDGYIIMSLDEYISSETCSLYIGINDQFNLEMTLTFDIDDINSDYIQEGMYVIVDNVGKMRLDQPTILIDGAKKVYTVTASGSSCELENKSCNIEINMGTKTSQEYLVTYVDGETELLVDPYTNIPFDWIMLHNTFPEQLRILKTMYNNNYFGTKSSGITTITNASLIKEIMDILTVMPRLKKKISKTVSTNGLDSYTSVDYVEITESSTEVTKVVLNSNFGTRIDALIPFYERYRDQLSLVTILMNATGSPWTVENISGNSLSDFELYNRKFQFQIDGNAYGFLLNDFQNASKCIVLFNNFNRTIQIKPIEQFGEDTGIVASYESILDSLNITNINDTIATRLYVTGGNDLSIEEVNFGCNYVDNLDYKMNAKVTLQDGTQRRLYVSDSLASKYNSYKNLKDSNRSAYAKHFINYKNSLKDIDEIKYKVPNDVLSTNWGTFSEEELHESLKNYKNLRAALVTMYKDDVGNSGVGADGNPIESVIKNTMYWYDYKAYTDAITQIECALSVYPYYKDQTKWSDVDIAKYKEAIRAWETEFTLFGTVELQAKIAAYDTSMKVLIENKSVIVSASGAPIPWNSLTADQRADYGDVENNYYYDAYNYYYTNKQGAKAELNKLNAQLTVLERNSQSYLNSIKDMNVRMSVESNFTKEEINIINLLIRDADYSNENILTTSINTVEETIDLAMDLYNDALDRASITSRPQLKFSASMNNILAIDEFRRHGDKIDIGNWIYVQYADDVYVKLRMVGFEFNPRIPTSPEISVTFSDNVLSRNGITDFEFLIGSSVSTNGRSGGSSGGGSGDGYGESNGIDVTISNTMLAKLLNSETFGTRVRDVILDTIDVGSLKAGMVTVEGLKKGTTIIDGGCIKTGAIKSENYNGADDNINNTSGSILRLNDGQFCLGGQNGIKFDGSSVTLGSNVDISWESIKGAPSELDMTGYSRVNVIGNNNLTTWKKQSEYFVTVDYDENDDCYKLAYTGDGTAHYGVSENIPVNPSTTYTLSFEVVDSIGVGYKNFDNNTEYCVVQKKVFNESGIQSIEITTDSTTNYLGLYFFTDTSMNHVGGVRNIKLETGSGYTGYTSPNMTDKYITTITKDTIKTSTILCKQLEADGTIQGQSFVCGSNGETRLNQDGTFALGGANGIVYTGDQIRLGSNVSASGDIISGGTISGTTISGGIINGTTINVGTNASSYINSDGTFRLGGANGINYDNSKITLGSDVTLTWANISDADSHVPDDVDLNGYVRENLLTETDLTKWTKQNTNVLVDYTDGYYKVSYNGTTTNTYGIAYNMQIEPSTTYTISFEVFNGFVGFGKYLSSTQSSTFSITGTSYTTDGVKSETFTSSSTQKYLRLYFYRTGSNNNCCVGNVKVEKGSSASSNIITTDKRITEITKHEISTAVISADQITSGTLDTVKFVSRYENDMYSNLTISSGTFRDQGTSSASNIARAIFERGGAFNFYYSKQNQVEDFINASHGTILNYSSINGIMSAERLSFSSLGTSNQKIFSVVNSDATFLTNYATTLSGAITLSGTVSGTGIDKYISDYISPITVNSNSFTMKTGFANQTGSVKKYTSLGIVVIDIKVEYLDDLSNTVVDVLQLPTSVRPSIAKALTANAYNTGNAERKTYINCYINSSGMIRITPSASMSLNGNYANLISITGIYFV